MNRGNLPQMSTEYAQRATEFQIIAFHLYCDIVSFYSSYVKYLQDVFE